MSQIAIAVTLGSPDTAGEVPITTSTLSASIAAAVSDTATLATEIGTVQTVTTTADNDVAQVQTDLGVATTAANTANGDITTLINAYKTFAAALIAITGDTFNTGTLQFTSGGSTGLTHAQVATLEADLNTCGTDMLTALTDTSTVQTDVATATTDTNTAKAQTALAKTDAAALSTSAISADLTAAQAIISSANVFIQTDSSVVTNVALLNGALVTALTFVRSAALLPT